MPRCKACNSTFGIAPAGLCPVCGEALGGAPKPRPGPVVTFDSVQIPTITPGEAPPKPPPVPEDQKATVSLKSVPTPTPVAAPLKETMAMAAVQITKSGSQIPLAIANPPPGSRGTGWAAWETAGILPARIRVGGHVWRPIDEIEMREPGGEAISARGYRHEEGTCYFTLRNLGCDKPLAVVRQMRAFGEQRASGRAGGRNLGELHEAEVDMASPWRNRTFVVPETVVRHEQISLDFTDEGSQGGLSWFRVWAFQPED